jgi:hypothetical protein
MEQISCPKCRKALQLSPEALQAECQCPACGAVFQPGTSQYVTDLHDRPSHPTRREVALAEPEDVYIDGPRDLERLLGKIRDQRPTTPTAPTESPSEHGGGRWLVVFTLVANLWLAVLLLAYGRHISFTDGPGVASLVVIIFSSLLFGAFTTAGLVAFVRFLRVLRVLRGGLRKAANRPTADAPDARPVGGAAGAGDAWNK